MAIIGFVAGMLLAGLGVVALMFAYGEASSATPRLTAVGLAAIVLGVALVVGAARALSWAFATASGDIVEH